MKALVYVSPEKIELQEMPSPAPREGEVLLEVSSAGICGSDIHGFLGHSERRKPGLVMGHEAVARIAEVHARGRPVLVGTRSVGASEHLSELLEREGLVHRVLNARRDRDEAEIVAQAGGRGRITVATNMAGRGTDIKLGPGVAELGGLHVIATERHEARRIDRQLFGRCARQGDPGSYEEIVSLEDQLVLLYLPEWLRTPARWLASGGGRRLALALVTFAQRKAQARGARMRVQMQKMDEYLGNVLAFTGRLE